MAGRKKVAVEYTNDAMSNEKAGAKLASALGEAFDKIIEKQFGQYKAPPPIVTPTGIVPLDYLLGGGLVSSKPIMISSTPESGKSTFCFQFSRMFQKTHENGIIVYLDIEGAGNAAEGDTLAKVSRIESFGLDTGTFKYQPVILDIVGVFNVLEALADIKDQFEQKLKKEFYVAVIWDSISATRSSRTDSVDDPNKTIGFKARELSFKLEKYSPLLAFKKFTFIIVDQVRANLKAAIDGVYAPKEKTVGDFNDFKSATSINSLNHLTGQWMYLSKKKTIDYSDGMGIDGWELVVLTEKNKNAPSKYAITCIFDKNHGIDKFWTEYRFISDMSPSEMRIFKKSETHLKYPICIKTTGNQISLKVVDPENHKNVLYKSNNFFRKNAKKLYETDSEFREWFDYAVNASSYLRIVEGLFKCNEISDALDTSDVDESQEIVNEQLQGMEGEFDDIVENQSELIQAQKSDIQDVQDDIEDDSESMF